MQYKIHETLKFKNHFNNFFFLNKSLIFFYVRKINKNIYILGLTRIGTLSERIMDSLASNPIA
jgi:hypothetical protein